MIKRLLYLLAFHFQLSIFNCSAQWSAGINLSPGAVSAGLNESMGSCLGVSGDTVHVVWTDKINNTHAILYYAHSLDTGLTWSVPVAITGAGGNAWNPAITVSGSNVHVVWREIDTVTNLRTSWYMHSLDGGNAWSVPLYLDSTADWPAVAVQGDTVYMANDRVVSQSPYNTEIFFMRSLDNGITWSAPAQQITFAVGRSEDEAITAQGSHVHMSWNDNRTGQFQIFYKESSDYGVTWGPDVVVDLPFDYNTMVSIDGEHADVVACGAPTGHYQLLLSQSADTGATWPVMNNDLSNDTAHTYFLPHMTRDGCDLHVICNSSGGAKYFHSGDGGATWAPAFPMTGATFIAYTGDVLHVIYVNTGHIYYTRNPTGNAGTHCAATRVPELFDKENGVKVFPNPFTNELRILWNQTTGIINSASLFDITGKEILSRETSEDELKINTESLADGFYFLRVGGENCKVVKEN